MKKNHLVIYIPGLGDQKNRGQSLMIWLWRVLSMKVIFHKVGWADREPFGPKLDGLLAEIDRLKQEGATVSLVGVSAGASAALNAYIQRKVSIWRVVFVCGKLGNFYNINPRYFEENPAFQDSIEQAKTSLSKLSVSDKVKMLSMQPIYDEIVYVPDTKIRGVINKRILSVSHVASIAVALVFYARFIIKFIKSD